MNAPMRNAVFAALLCLFAVALPAQQTCPMPESMKARFAATPDADTFADLGIALANQRLYDCAVLAFANSLRLKSDSANVLFMYGTSLFLSGHAQDALIPLQASEVIDVRNLKLHLILAAVFDQLQRNAEAETEWRAAVEADPLSTDAVDGLSQELVLEQKYQAAIDLLTDPLSARQRTALQSLNLGAAYAGAGQVAAAVSALRDGLNTTPDSLALANQLADLLAQAGRIDEADAAYTMALQRHPADIDTALNRFRMLMSASPDRAKTVGQDLLRNDPQNWEVLYLNGVLEAQNGDMAAARQHLEGAIAENDGFALAHSLLGVVLARLRDFAGAQTQLERAIVLGDTSQEVQDNLARVREAQQP
ncbi:MAG: tetratricopeptide repeat protein [Acidobacteriaceae bacterium]